MSGDGSQGRDAYRSFGAYLRSQRQLAQLTLRQLADLSSISNPYLSQIERGLHQPSVAVIRSIADALNLSADALLAQVAGLEDNDSVSASINTESVIRADPRLSGSQKSALLSVYRSMVGHPDEAGDETAGESAAAPQQRDSTPDPTGEAGSPPRPQAAQPSRSRSRARSGRSATGPPKPDATG